MKIITFIYVIIYISYYNNKTPSCYDDVFSDSNFIKKNNEKTKKKNDKNKKILCSKIKLHKIPCFIGRFYFLKPESF